MRDESLALTVAVGGKWSHEDKEVEKLLTSRE